MCLNKQSEPEPLKRRSTSAKFKTSFQRPGNFNTLNMHFEKEKPQSKKIFANKRSGIDFDNKPSTEFPVQKKKRAMFSIYDKTTQISNLPGAVKRLEIKDDKRSYNRFNQSYTAKVKKDYASKISCLPGDNVLF